MLRHHGFFKWNPYAPKGAVEHFIKELNKFPANDPEIREWNAGPALTPAVWPRGDHFDYGLNCLVEDRDAMVRYNRSVWHQELVALVGPVRAWIVAWDFTVESAAKPTPAKEGMVRHHGFFKWKAGAPQDAVHLFIDELNKFPVENPEIMDWNSGPALVPGYWAGGDRWDYGLTCLLEDHAAVERYNAHPWHQHLISLLPPMRGDILAWDFVVENAC